MKIVDTKVERKSENNVTVEEIEQITAVPLEQTK